MSKTTLIATATINSDRACSYHRKGCSFKGKRLAPDGLCPEAFNTLYPHCFSLLHIPGPNDISLQCPQARGGARFRAYRMPARWFRRVKNIVARFISIIYPIDIIRYRVLIEVVKRGEDCPYRYSRGSTFELNLGQKSDEPCPAAFNSLFPSLFVFLKDGGLNKGMAVASCPDHKVNVQLGLMNNDSKGSRVPQNSASVECMSEGDVKIKVTGRSPKCPIYHTEEREYDLSGILDKIGIRCLAAFHVLFPYYLTLFKDGAMPGYYARDKHAAILQCPNVKNRIEMMIQKDRKGDGHVVRVIGQRNTCPKLLCPGQRIKLDFEKSPVCIYALGSISPYANMLKFNQGDEKITIGCPTCNDGSALLELSLKIA